MSDIEVSRLVAALTGASSGDEDEDGFRYDRPKDVQAKVLKDIFDASSKPCQFKPGDLVEIIPQFSVYKFPKKGQLAVVAHVSALTPERIERLLLTDSSAVGAEDMVILTLARNGSGVERWMHFSVESWRFQPYEGEICE